MSLVIISHVKTTTDTTTKKQSKLYLHLVTSKCCSCQISANRMPIIILKNHLLRNTSFYINFQLHSSPFYWHTKFVQLSKGLADLKQKGTQENDSISSPGSHGLFHEV